MGEPELPPHTPRLPQSAWAWRYVFTSLPKPKAVRVIEPSVVVRSGAQLLNGEKSHASVEIDFSSSFENKLLSCNVEAPPAGPYSPMMTGRLLCEYPYWPVSSGSYEWDSYTAVLRQRSHLPTARDALEVQLARPLVTLRRHHVVRHSHPVLLDTDDVHRVLQRAV